MQRIGIFGRGRLGALVADAVDTASDLERLWSVGRDADLASLAEVDVAIDLSVAAAVPDHVAWARRTSTDLVIGATGWDPSLLEADSSQEIGVLTAPNFSLSMAFMRQLSLILGRYAAVSPETVDLGVHETHHRHKADAPSGSAVLLAGAVAEGAGIDPTQVGTSSQRLGAVVGQHEVIYASPSETISIAHEAHNREVFARGALTAARWIHGRSGRWTFDDLAAAELSTVFTPESPRDAESQNDLTHRRSHAR